MLRGNIGTLVSIVRVKENLLRFLEADSAPRISPQALALPLIEVKPHDGITVIPQLACNLVGDSRETLIPAEGMVEYAAPQREIRVRMGYYVRVLALKTDPPSLEELRISLPEGQELQLETGEETEWSQSILRHKTGEEIALIERNPVLPGELGEEELNEFIEDVKGEKPDSAAKWLGQFFPRVKTIYAFQLLSGTDIKNGWDGVSSLQGCIRQKMGGILQADLEGFSNEHGHQILWQFISDHDGPWEMTVLDAEGKWIAFEMDLRNPTRKQAFLDGRVPEGVKRL